LTLLVLTSSSELDAIGALDLRCGISDSSQNAQADLDAALQLE
jgi:hypothetical protein